MILTDAEKVSVFTDELKLIKDRAVRRITIFALTNVNDRFFEDGASSTGKYHPAYAQGKGGLVRHTKAAVYFAKEMLSLQQNDGIGDITKDCIYSALILHDTCKLGVNWENRYTCHDHPLLVKALLSKSDLEQLEEEGKHQVEVD